MKKFEVGDVSIAQVIEWAGGFATPGGLIADYEKTTFDKHIAQLAPDYYNAETGQLIAFVQSWLIKTGGRTILFDTGCGNGKHRPALPLFDMLDTPFLADLEVAGAKPEEIDTVVCSHLHVDHVGWNTQLEAGQWRPAFPNAKYIFPKVDFDFWNPANADKVGRQVGEIVNAGVFEDSVEPIIKEGMVEFAEGMHEVADGMMLEPAPGHTPGQMRLRIDSGDDKALLVADVIHHPIQVYQPTWNSVFCEDLNVARQTRHDALTYCADTGALLMPAHFGGLNAVHIGRDGVGFRIVEF